MPGLMLTFFAAIAVITWDEISTYQRVPKPQRYIYTTLVWMVLGVVGELGAGKVAAAFGLGLVLSMLYAKYNKDPKGIAGRAGGLVGRFESIAAGDVAGRVGSVAGEAAQAAQ